MYRGLADPKTGAQLYPGLAPGSEPFWPHRDPANPFAIPVSHYKWLVVANPDWDWRSFDFSDTEDYAAHVKAEARLAPILNATSPDLKAFRQRGGKLLQYHGWNDQLISPQNSIDYYQSVLKFFGSAADVDGFYRLFMAPGMAHCSGGTGPNSFDMQAALERWVERGAAPDQILATRATNGIVDRIRPLCRFPRTAVYSGRGDTNDAANFTCQAAVTVSVRRSRGRLLSTPGIAPDDALVPALCEEVRTPPVAGPRKSAVSPADDCAVGSINNTHHIAAALGDEGHRVAFVLVARYECGRIRHRLCFELPNHCCQPRG